ncbi:MAG: hypothetical protein DRP65_06530 [Planctomycetota bacterium]|nr:MAG: hypothetical protein DRP65_06530 [Planctomycetota bacterium]
MSIDFPWDNGCKNNVANQPLQFYITKQTQTILSLYFTNSYGFYSTPVDIKTESPAKKKKN